MDILCAEKLIKIVPTLSLINEIEKHHAPLRLLAEDIKAGRLTLSTQRDIIMRACQIDPLKITDEDLDQILAKEGISGVQHLTAQIIAVCLIGLENIEDFFLPASKIAESANVKG